MFLKINDNEVIVEELCTTNLNVCYNKYFLLHYV